MTNKSKQKTHINIQITTLTRLGEPTKKILFFNDIKHKNLEVSSGNSTRVEQHSTVKVKKNYVEMLTVSRKAQNVKKYNNTVKQ